MSEIVLAASLIFLGTGIVLIAGTAMIYLILRGLAAINRRFML